MKTVFEEAINSGQVNTKEDIYLMAKELGIRITRDGVKSNGLSYLGLRTPNGKRFRLELPFESEPLAVESEVALIHHPSRKSKDIQDYWIYALMATSQDGQSSACYIGQTTNPQRRFREHLNLPRLGKGAWELRQWAEEHSSQVRAILLESIRALPRRATELEAAWLKLAFKAGLELPGVNRWGQFPKAKSTVNTPKNWPEWRISELSMPLAEIMTEQFPSALVSGLKDTHTTCHALSHRFRKNS